MEALVKFAQNGLPVPLPCLDLVELMLHIRRELHVDHVVEVLDHKIRHDDAQGRRGQALVFFDYIFAVLDRCDDRRVGRRTADAAILHCLDQRRLGIARGRVGEMLLLFGLFLP